MEARVSIYLSSNWNGSVDICMYAPSDAAAVPRASTLAKQIPCSNYDESMHAYCQTYPAHLKFLPSHDSCFAHYSRPFQNSPLPRSEHPLRDHQLLLRQLPTIRTKPKLPRLLPNFQSSAKLMPSLTWSLTPLVIANNHTRIWNSASDTVGVGTSKNATTAIPIKVIDR